MRFYPVVAASVLALALGQGQARAQVSKAFKVSGAGVAPEGLPLPGQDPRSHWIVGEATHLGRHTGEGAVRTDSAAPDLPNGVITGEFGSATPFVFTAADGDKLATWYGRTDHGASTPGTFELTVLGVEDGMLLVEAVWVAEFVVDPAASTGRFAGVTGSWVMVARSEPFLLGSSDPLGYWWEGEGRLTFPRGK